ncbi:efflux RND transporter permease subunit [Sandaracinus amylolyticus]|uniref:Cobalt-zinc-cadmium resistance protein CzcA n=1 Tax=Sandaracinus amylolyticus TaxID=927083 RepID=A0A0F6SGJ4_9BACT|nr:efflux RND transporter permease subunit [Sandaracinus amylolyticus]AKF08799.1 Cobalt-zinc-cadmium resistance protein CzcA [Sandaracinus amylolyticus]
MIARIIDACAHHRGLVLLAGLALGIAGWVAMQRVPLDAIPDLSDPQVIVFTEWEGRSPTLIEDQITYPIVTALLGAPRVVEVRGQSMFGMSFVYVVFEEGTDPYWARSRVLEQLQSASARLPAGVAPRLGPDASGIGWIYQYALVDTSGTHDLGELRTLQDFSIRYALASVPGVAEVASVGGFLPQYQVTLDPARLRAHGLSVPEVADAIRRSNQDVGGRLLEMSEREYVVRGRGYLQGSEDLERVVVRRSESGAALTVGDLGTVRVGGDLRRGAADWNGEGEVVSGIVVMRQGENALDVIRRVEARIDEIAPSLPDGVELRAVYDRSALIERAIDTLRHALTEEMIVVALVILLFLLHVRSALLPIIALPLAVLIAFIPMALFGMPATIMSLGGIAIAIGATVDAEIVMVEAAHKKLEHAPPDLTPEQRQKLLADAAHEVTPAIFFSLLIVAVSFIPVFGLTGQAGRLFRPLAFTKTCVMLSAALLSITVAPAMRDLLIRGKIRSEEHHPVSRIVRRFYEPFVHVALENPRTTLLIGLFAVLSALPLVPRLGSEFMPPLDEGDLLYMPTTFPGISIEEARRQMQIQDALLREFPEVENVLGKVGRADTPTDPAPLSMAETVVQLKPRSAWRTRYERRWYHGHAPSWMRPALTAIWPEFRTITREELVDEMNARLRLVGWTNAFTQPIRNRIDMLATGIRTPVGIKVHGHDLLEIERAGIAIERVVNQVPGTRSVLFERQQGGVYLDVVPDRDALARYGLTIEDVNEVVERAIGGDEITTTIEGRARFGVSVRYAEDFRSSPEAIADALVPVGEGRHVALREVADVRVEAGPPMVRDESGMLVGYVYVDVDEGRDLGSYVEEARAAVESAIARGAITLPEGGHLRWTGQYELMLETEARMKILIPLALLAVILLLYLQFRDLTEVLIVLLSVPFALVGSVWALWLLDYHLSTAVWVGVIALIGLAAQTGVVMIVYIDQAYEKRLREGRIRTLADIVDAHAEGTIQRVRPKLMTVGTMLVGLVPLLWAEGSGADVMKRIAAPMVGGLITSAFLTLELIPVVYTYWRNEQLVHRRIADAAPEMLLELRKIIVIVQASAALLVASLALRLYVDGYDAALTTAHVAGAGGLVLGAIVYGWARRRALGVISGRAPTDLVGESNV